MLDTIVVSIVVLAALGFLVFRFARKGAGCASCPAGRGCAGKGTEKNGEIKNCL